MCDLIMSENAKFYVVQLQTAHKLFIERVLYFPISHLKGLSQAKITKKSVILFWLLNMTI